MKPVQIILWELLNQAQMQEINNIFSWNHPQQLHPDLLQLSLVQFLSFWFIPLSKDVSPKGSWLEV